jgi:antitoxin YefM
MKQTTSAKAHENLKELLDDVVEGGEPVIVGCGKGRSVAFISTRDLRGLLETIHLLRSPNNAKRRGVWVGRRRLVA